jgi:hypothetical protein
MTFLMRICDNSSLNFGVCLNNPQVFVNGFIILAMKSVLVAGTAEGVDHV